MPYQVVHEQKFKDLPSSNCLSGLIKEHAGLGILGPGIYFPLRETFYHWIFFIFHKVNTKIPQLAFPYSL